MIDEHPTYSEVGECNIRERYGSISRLVDMRERDDDRDENL